MQERCTKSRGQRTDPELREADTDMSNDYDLPNAAHACRGAAGFLSVPAIRSAPVGRDCTVFLHMDSRTCVQNLWVPGVQSLAMVRGRAGYGRDDAAYNSRQES